MENLADAEESKNKPTNQPHLRSASKTGFIECLPDTPSLVFR